MIYSHRNYEFRCRDKERRGLKRSNYIYTNFITGETGHFGQELAVGDPAEDDVFVVDNGNIETAGRANFSGPISGPSIAATTGSFDKLIISGDAHVSGDFYVSGTTYINDVIDTTVSGTISGYTGVFGTTTGKNGSFTDSLTISGLSVLTGVEVAGGGEVVAGTKETLTSAELNLQMFVMLTFSKVAKMPWLSIKRATLTFKTILMSQGMLAVLLVILMK